VAECGWSEHFEFDIRLAFPCLFDSFELKSIQDHSGHRQNINLSFPSSKSILVMLCCAWLPLKEPFAADPRKHLFIHLSSSL
jgi:hypothetical protein